MSMQLCKSVSACVASLLVMAAGSANAASVTLDFETAATGMNIVGSPLVTSLGTIMASASTGSTLIEVRSNFEYTGIVGNVLYHLQSGIDSSYAQLAFDFDVSSVSFLYGGYVAGAFTAQALDSAFNIVDSFFDDNTSLDLPGGPATLSGNGIRYFRFSDSPGGGSASIVDDVTISSSVPLPTTLALTLLGLAGLTASRRTRS